LRVPPWWGPKSEGASVRQLPVARLALALFATQSGFHAFTAALPLALSHAGIVTAEIGLIVGAAAVAQVPAALVGGVLIDRFGALRVFTLGGICYLTSAALLLLAGFDPTAVAALALFARLGQGIGVAWILPAALSVVPTFVAPARRGLGLALISAAHNLSLAVFPPVALLLLYESGLTAIAASVLAIVVVGLFVSRSVNVETESADPIAEMVGKPDTPSAPSTRPARRVLGFAWRGAWALPLLVILAYVVHWGVVTAYLPERAELGHADVGLFFAADGIAVLLLRLPSGWLSDRVAPSVVIATGLALTATALGVLLAPLTTPALVLAGTLTGTGAVLIVTPLLVELARRSSGGERGSAFALFSASMATGLAAGSIGLSPVVAAAGFQSAVELTLVSLGVAALFALFDHRSRWVDAPL
jgi:MFS family permease